MCLTHPVNFPCGRKPEYPEKTHDFRQSVDFYSFHMRTGFESHWESSHWGLNLRPQRWKASALTTWPPKPPYATRATLVLVWLGHESWENSRANSDNSRLTILINLFSSLSFSFIIIQLQPQKTIPIFIHFYILMNWHSLFSNGIIIIWNGINQNTETSPASMWKVPMYGCQIWCYITSKIFTFIETQWKVGMQIVAGNNCSVLHFSLLLMTITGTTLA
jgi:hypothetical protein